MIVARKVMSVTANGVLTFHTKRRIKIPVSKQPAERHHLKIDPEFWEFDKGVAAKVAAFKLKKAEEKKLEANKRANALNNVDKWFNKAITMAN